MKNHKSLFKTVTISMFIILPLVAFGIGYNRGKMNIEVIRTANEIDLFPKGQPNYNLPFIELYTIDIELEDKNYERAKQRTIFFLDMIFVDLIVRQYEFRKNREYLEMLSQLYQKVAPVMKEERRKEQAARSSKN